MPTYRVTFRNGEVAQIVAANKSEAVKKAKQLRGGMSGHGNVGGGVAGVHEQKSETWGEYLDKGGHSPRFLDKRGKSTTER